MYIIFILKIFKNIIRCIFIYNFQNETNNTNNIILFFLRLIFYINLYAFKNN